MSLYKNPSRRHSLRDLAKRPKDEGGWEWSYAEKLEAEYAKQLNPKELLAYLEERIKDAFLDNI